MKESGDIGKINIMKQANGTTEVLATAFTHVKDAWHDNGIQFSNISLPFNQHVSSLNNGFENINLLITYITL